MQFASKNGLRVLEMLKQFDRDGSGAISRAEFVRGIKVSKQLFPQINNSLLFRIRMNDNVA